MLQEVRTSSYYIILYYFVLVHIIKFSNLNKIDNVSKFDFQMTNVYICRILSGDVLVLTALMSGGKHVERMARLLVNISGRKFSC